MSHHPNSLWGIIKRAVKSIELLNNFYFGNESWVIIKQMEREIIESQTKSEMEIHDIYRKQACELEDLRLSNDILSYKVHRYEYFLKKQGYSFDGETIIVCEDKGQSA